MNLLLRNHKTTACPEKLLYLHLRGNANPAYQNPLMSADLYSVLIVREEEKKSLMEIFHPLGLNFVQLLSQRVGL